MLYTIMKSQLCILLLVWLSENSVAFHSCVISTSTLLLRQPKFYSSHCSINSKTLVKSSTSGDSISELSSALAVLDEKWKKNNNKSNRWEKFVVTPADANAGIREESVYLLQPPENFIRPTSCILFLGGAALGQYPHIVYSGMLTKLSNSMGTAVIAAPFSTGLDHFELAKQSGELFRKALRKCEDKFLWPENLPLYCLAHSLGAKLTIINIAARDIGEDLMGVGLISYNNFGLGQSIGMARSFLQTMRSGNSENIPTGSMNDTVINSLFGFVEQVTQGMGLEFQPSPPIMDRLISMKFDPSLQTKTRLFCFDEDDLDCSRRLIECCEGTGPEISGLPGSHLTPVYLKLGIDDLGEDIPDETKQIASQVIGLESASLGNEDELNSLVREIVAWMSGRPPSRDPKWSSKKQIPDGSNQLPTR